VDGQQPPSVVPARPPGRGFAASSATRVVALSGVLAGIAVLVYDHVLRGLAARPAPFHLHPLILMVVFAGAECCMVHVQFREEAHSCSLSEAPIVLGLLCVAPDHMMWAALIGSGLALALHRRQAVMKLVFNLSQLALQMEAAILVFRLLTPSEPSLGPTMWLAAIAAGLSAAAVADVTVSLVMLVHNGHVKLGHLRQVVVVSVVSCVINTNLGIIAATLLWTDVRTVVLLGVMAAAVVVAYRGYAALMNRHASLELLYEFTRAVGRSNRADDVVAAVLAQARELLHADFAAVCFATEDGRIAHRVVLVGDGPVAGGSEAHPVDSLYVRIRDVDGARSIGRNTKDPLDRALLDAAGLTDVVIAPLAGDRATSGFLCAGNRLGNVSTFDGADARLFETIAIHASVALENGRLVDRLRHEALHDSLTGLPNRAMFHQQVTKAMVEHPEEPAAVFLMDLDRFKDINDSLGHHAGDLVLQQVATRLREVLGSDPAIARLGGDEFAVFVRGASEAIRGTFEQPFQRGDLSLDLGATIGIAVHPEHGDDATTLLRRADVAMYAAKGQQPGYAVYSPEFDDSTTHRLALVGELRHGIAAGQLVLYYQPKASLATGAVIGAETLVRWNHPEHGLVYPDDFIPLAERTGLIGPLTNVVLEQALIQCRTWLDEGLSLPVAVNLSARSLVDTELPGALAALLRRTRVPAGALTVEVTESSVMSDPGRTITVLHRLREMGISISVDDFGTGYSSLSYLKRLPVNEVKIDKSFVINMTHDSNDATIVRSIIDLGRNLGLRVVAEGVENREIWDELARLGCEVAQGYHLSKPMPADEVKDWIRLTSSAPAFL
jgi:diguanylate cyclase (GGDEF)-like protein